MVFSSKFAAYFQNTFSQEHLWVFASEIGLHCLLLNLISHYLEIMN